MKGEVWLWLISGVLFVSLLLHEGQLFVIAAILLLVAVTSRVWERYCLTGLGYTRSLGQARASFGERIPLTIEVTNEKPLPLAWLEIEDTVPGRGLNLQPLHTGPSHIPGRRLLTMLLSVRWYERVRRHYIVECDARGVHAFGPATLRTGDVFGLSSQEMEFHAVDHLLVYPKIVPLERLGLPPSNPFGDVPVHKQWLFEDPLRTVGIRDYRPGDNPRRLHWKATAHAPSQTLKVKLLEPTTSHRVHVLLNVGTSEQNWSWQGYDPDALEAAITTAASVANWAIERNLPAGLGANANLFHSSQRVSIGPSRDPRQLMHILEALARVVPMPSMSAESLVHLESSNLAFGTTVVMVSTVAHAGLIDQLRRLKRGGHQPVLLLITSDEQPLAMLHGVPAHAIRIEDAQ